MSNNLTDFLMRTYGKKVVGDLYLCMFPVEPQTIRAKLIEVGDDQLTAYRKYYKAYKQFHARVGREINDAPEEMLKILEAYIIKDIGYRAWSILKCAFPWDLSLTMLQTSPYFKISTDFDFWSEIEVEAANWLRKTFGHEAQIIKMFAEKGAQNIFGFDANYLPEWHPYKILLRQSKSFTDKETVFRQL